MSNAEWPVDGENSSPETIPGQPVTQPRSPTIPPIPAISEGEADGDESSPGGNPSPDDSSNVVDLDAVRAKIDELTLKYETPVRSGSAQPVGLGLEPPEHFDANDLLKAALKPINWQVENLWTENAKILLASEPKAGKTFCVCDFAISLAQGAQVWEGLKVVKPGAVGIIAAEDDEGEIGRRLHRMCRAKGILLGDLPIHWWPGDRIRLNRARDIDWIRQQIRKYDIKLMIYDPMARLMDGDENSKECVSGVLTPASEIVKRDKCSIMVVHHLGKDDPERPKTLAQRVRGSSDIRSWYTTGIFLTGSLENGRIGVELEQRTSGKIRGSFNVRAVEKEEESVYGLGTIKLVANLSEGRGAGESSNQQMIDNAAEKILQLVENKGAFGLTTSEIAINLGIGKTLMNAALKKLIREEFKVAFEEAKDIPDNKVLVALNAQPRTRSRRQEVPSREQVQEERQQSQQAELFPPVEPDPAEDADQDAQAALAPDAGDIFS